jgi:hypothetical protein
VVPTSNRRLAEYTWEGELAIAENLLFRSAALEWESVYGWRNLRPALRPFIRRCLRRTERVADTLAVLKLLHTISTLPSKSIVDAAISAWGPGEGALSRRVAGLSSLLGVSETRELQRLRAWREGLQSQLERAPASRAAALQRKLQSASFADHMDRRLQATLAKTEEMLGLRWLRQCSQDALAAHMKVPTLGSEAVHGVRMALKLRTNRRVAHKLVRAAVRGDADWRLRHPANQAWMADARARGLDVDAWLAPRSLTLHDLVARTSTGPLEDLLMGERFNTCLGLDGCNAHSAVSNAAELNKRVLWVERDGRIVGRKLVGLDLSAGGSGLLGFRLYGEFDPRALLAVDLLAMDLGRATGAPLWDEMASEDLALFTEWYDDGEAAWDWWQHLPREDAVRDACKPEKWDTDPRAATARLALLEPRVWAWALEHKTLPPDVASLAWP